MSIFDRVYIGDQELVQESHKENVDDNETKGTNEEHRIDPDAGTVDKSWNSNFPAKKIKKYKRRSNRTSKSRVPHTNSCYSFSAQYQESYNSFAPFDYRSWNNGQRYYIDAPPTSPIKLSQLYFT